LLTPVLMPQLGLEVTEGTVVEILVAPGASVAKDEAVMVLATDKADTEIAASAAGVVREIAVQVGDTVEIGATLLWLADSADEPLDSAVRVQLPAAADEDPPRFRAAPVARRAAAAHGIELASVAGSGPRGRITLKDVERTARDRPTAVPSAPAQQTNGTAAVPEAGLEPLSPLRRAVARRMALSQREVPQFQLVREVDATHLLAQKVAAAAASAGGARLGVNDLLIQAIAETLARHPDLAAAFVDGDVPALRRPEGIDVGLAVATDRGLLVPVIRGAHTRSLREIAADRQRLVEEARAGTLPLGDMTGAAVSLSNLGSFGVDRFTAMVNPGESTIVAVGRVVDRVVPRGRGIAVVPTLTVTVSFDHRVVDGAAGARAVSELADLLEGAMAWRI
jgi:pyruvate dehydrogenase E2 component (dihydrolipoamide acetyltransferase)